MRRGGAEKLIQITPTAMNSPISIRKAAPVIAEVRNISLKLMARLATLPAPATKYVGIKKVSVPSAQLRLLRDHRIYEKRGPVCLGDRAS